MKYIADTTGLMLAVPVYDPETDKFQDVKFVPVIAWAIEKKYKELPVRILPIAPGVDNEADEVKIVCKKDAEEWYTCNGQNQGRGKENLIKMFNIQKEVELL